MPDKQNTKYISYSSSSIKVRIIKKNQFPGEANARNESTTVLDHFLFQTSRFLSRVWPEDQSITGADQL